MTLQQKFDSLKNDMLGKYAVYLAEIEKLSINDFNDVEAQFKLADARHNAIISGRAFLNFMYETKKLNLNNSAEN